MAILRKVCQNKKAAAPRQNNNSNDLSRWKRNLNKKHQYPEKTQGNETAKKPILLTNTLKIKSVCPFRQKLQLVLCAFCKTFPIKTAASDSDLRLDDIITCPMRILLRLNETNHPTLLIRF